jgi:hypothetical protein
MSVPTVLNSPKSPKKDYFPSLGELANALKETLRRVEILEHNQRELLKVVKIGERE